MEKISNKELFETMPVPKAIAALAVPTVVSQVINLVYNIADAFFIGRTGNSYMVAAVSLAYTIFMMTIAFSNLFGIGGGSLIARLYGIYEYDEAEKVGSFCFYGAIGSALLYSLLIGLFLDPLLILFGASPATLGFARQYTIIVVVLGNVPVILSTTIAHLLRNVGYSKESGFGLGLGGVLNLILDPIFMFVLLPEGMEVAGAAVATLISNVIACIYLTAVMKKVSSKTPLSMDPRKAAKVRKRDLYELFYVGVPAAILTVLFDAANIVINALMAAYGDFMLAALGIALKAERVAYAFNVGICQGMMPLLAYNYSSGNRKRMNDTIKYGRIIGLITLSSCLILMEICAAPISKLFLSGSAGDPAEVLTTVTYAAVFIRLRSLALPALFINYHTSICLQAMGNGRDTLIQAVVRQAVCNIPLMFLMDHFLGLYGLGASFFVGETCVAVYSVLLLRSFLKKKRMAGGGAAGKPETTDGAGEKSGSDENEK